MAKSTTVKWQRPVYDYINPKIHSEAWLVAGRTFKIGNLQKIIDSANKTDPIEQGNMIDQQGDQYDPNDPVSQVIKERLGDVEWRLDNLYYIKDKYGRVIKMRRNPSQLKLWKERHYLNIILKDRQRGFSTFICILILDTCIFNANQTCGIIDITLDDAKRKLAKIRFAYERLPNAIKAAVPLVNDSKESMTFANGSEIYVGTSHRGGTLQILFLSEMGKISARNPDKAREIRTGALNTVAKGCWIFNESTAEGEAGEFKEDCDRAMALQRAGKKLTHLDYKFHFFGWWMGDENEIDPEGIEISEKDHKYFDDLEETLGIKINMRKRAWYVKKKEQQKDDMHREYPSTPEEAFRASVSGAYLSKQIARMEANGQIGKVPYDPSVPVNTGWDFGIRDTMCIWLHQYVAAQHRLIGFIHGTDEDILYYWRKLQQLPYIYGRHFLPHDGDARRLGTATDHTGPPKTIQQILEEAGMRNTIVVPRVNEKYTAIQEVRRFLPTAFIDQDECAEGLRCLKNFKREWDDKLGIWRNRPRHDWAMHGYDALETLVRGLGLHGTVDASANSGRIVQRSHQRPIDWRVV